MGGCAGAFIDTSEAELMKRTSSLSRGRAALKGGPEAYYVRILDDARLLRYASARGEQAASSYARIRTSSHTLERPVALDPEIKLSSKVAGARKYASCRSLLEADRSTS